MSRGEQYQNRKRVWPFTNSAWLTIQEKREKST
jgi:hypothetical protein